MCLALFAGLSAFCSHDAVNGANDRQESAGTVVVSAANPCFNSKQDKVKVHRQFWCKLIPWNTLRIIPIRSRHEKKKSEVEIQSKGIEQKAKREIQVGRITQVTPLDFNFCHLIAFFFKKSTVFSPTMQHAKATTRCLKSKTKVITSPYWQENKNSMMSPAWKRREKEG